MKTLEIIPNYYNQFKCSQINCPNTCCKGWTIGIDSNTYKKYAKLTDDYSSEILDKISTQSKKIYMHKYYCPFLDDDMLCKIQKKYGEDYVCQTCRRYPRTQKKFFNITRHDMLVSCPEIAKLVCSKKQLQYSFNFTQNNKKDDKDKYLEFFLKLNQIISNITIKYKNPNKRLFIYLSFIKDFYNSFKKTKYNYKNLNMLNKYNKDFFKHINKQYKPKYNIYSIYNLFLKIENSFKTFTFSNEAMYDLREFNIFDEKIKNNQQKLKDFQKQYKRFFKTIKKQVNFNNLLNYYIFQTFFESLTKLDISEQAFFAFYMSYVFKFVLFKAFLKENYKLTSDQIFMYISSASRAIEHTPSKNTIEEKLFFEKDFDFETIKKVLQSKF